MASSNLTLSLPGYHLVEQVYSGSKTVVYRAQVEGVVVAAAFKLPGSTIYEKTRVSALK